MKFAMLSDTHYISRRMLCNENDTENLNHIAVVEQAVRQAAEEYDTIIISGDLTDDGDRYSHEDFVKFLREIKAQGKNIYVIFATHDFHHHRAFVRKRGDTKAQFTSAPWEKPYFDPEGFCYKDIVKPEFSHLTEAECTPQLVESVTPEEIWQMYYEFGPEQSLSMDAGSFSYCVDLDDKTRCLMLNDIFRNEEALHDISATFTPSCLRWMKKMIDKSKEEGKYIFVCSHHPFMPCVPLHRLGASNRNMRAPEVGHMLADMGIDLAFTGHTHVSSLNFLESPKGNLLCDVMTPSVRFYPPAYRRVDLDGQNKRLAYETVDVNIPENADIKENTLREYYYKLFYKDYFRQYTSIKPPFNKIVAEGKVGEYFFLFKRKAKLTDAEYNALKDKKLFDFITDVIFNMVTGDGQFTPETPEYRLLMAFAAVADSIIDAQPFVDIRNKSLKGYTISQILEDMLFNNEISDNKAEFDFTVKPQKRIKTPVYTSCAGDIAMIIVCALAVPLSLLAPPVIAFGLPVKTIMKKIDLKKNPTKLFWRY